MATPCHTACRHPPHRLAVKVGPCQHEPTFGLGVAPQKKSAFCATVFLRPSTMGDARPPLAVGTRTRDAKPCTEIHCCQVGNSYNPKFNFGDCTCPSLTWALRCALEKVFTTQDLSRLPEFRHTGVFTSPSHHGQDRTRAFRGHQHTTTGPLCWWVVGDKCSAVNWSARG